MSLIDPFARVIEAAMYRGLHAGFRRFAEDLAALDPSAQTDVVQDLPSLDEAPVKSKGTNPPLGDFVQRLRLSGSPIESKTKGPNAPQAPRQRKRANNDQLG